MSRCVTMPCLVCDLDFVPMSACPLHILDGCIIFYTFAYVWHGSACIGVACITATKFAEAQCASATVRRFAAGPLFGKQKEDLFRLPSVRFIRVSHVLGPVAMHETACGGIAHSCLFPVSVRY